MFRDEVGTDIKIKELHTLNYRKLNTVLRNKKILIKKIKKIKGNRDMVMQKDAENAVNGSSK